MRPPTALTRRSVSVRILDLYPARILISARARTVKCLPERPHIPLSAVTILEEDLACQPGVSARQCYLLGVMLWLSYPGLAPPGDGGSRTVSVSHRERGG